MKHEQDRRCAARSGVLILCACLAWAGLAEAGDAERRTLVDRLVEFGYDEDDREQLLKGEIVIRKLEKEGKRELAIRAATLLPASADRAFEGADTLEFLKIDQTILAFGEIGDGPADATTFADLTLPDDELEKLVEAEPGSTFNLSSEEFAELAAAVSSHPSAAERKAAAMQAYREILAGRVRAYRAKGLAGIGKYSRGKKEIDPAADLADATPPRELSDPDLSIFYQALRGYPAPAPDDVHHRFVWLLQSLNDRPAVILAHRTSRKGKRISLLSQRNYYVGHTFDTLQILAGTIGEGDEGVVLYTNRTYTEQVAGFGSGAAHAIGRKIMSAEVEEGLRTILERLRSTP